MARRFVKDSPAAIYFASRMMWNRAKTRGGWFIPFSCRRTKECFACLPRRRVQRDAFIFHSACANVVFWMPQRNFWRRHRIKLNFISIRGSVVGGVFFIFASNDCPRTQLFPSINAAKYIFARRRFVSWRPGKQTNMQTTLSAVHTNTHTERTVQ
jgi:hypothetical protein